MERNLIFIKPDGVKRGICGKIISRFEGADLKITAMKLLWLTKQQANTFYPNDKQWLTTLGTKVKESFAVRGENIRINELEYGKRIKGYLVGYVTSGPVLAMVIEGNDAIQKTRKIVGSTDAFAAAAGTIRGDFCSDSVYKAVKEKRAHTNLIHAAGEKKEAEAQIKLIFGKMA